MSDVPGEATIIDGRYRMLRRVGSGGMADVVCAEDLQLGRRVAIKLLHRRFAEDAEFVERFRREASSAAGLQHPNVVAVYDRGAWDGTYYIAMEFLEGRSLKRLIQDEAPLDAALAIELTIQILRAARFAHKRGIIHRDLKPHNVIVDESGSTPHAKVTDFGIARAGASDMTETGSIMGTAQYLSPEQAQGHPVSAPSDLYAVGIILYEMLTGRVPFEGESAVSIALKQVSEAPLPPRALNPDISPALEAVVLRALEKDPARRFADADEFIAALEHAVAGIAPPAATTAAATTVLAGDATRVAAPQATGPMVPIPPPGAYQEVAHVEHHGPPTGVEPPPDGDGRGKWWVALLVGLLVAGALLAGLLLIPKQKVRVPGVVGSPQPEAQLALKQRGLSSDVVLRESADKPKGTVIGQEPAGGSRVTKDTVVTLFVSSGPGTARIPDVTGKGRKAARKQLEDLGFDVAERGETSDEVKAGHVIETRPGVGEELEKGETVLLVYSQGPEQIAIPSVTGLSEEDARSALETLGFQVATTEQEDEDAEPGTVLEQDPAARTKLPKGSKVTLTVAKEPAPVDVPDVTGRTKDYATKLLEDAGFSVEVGDPVPVTDQAQDGKVQTQDPSGGQAKKGSTVTIVIGQYQQTTTPGGTGTTPTTTTGGTGATTTTTPTPGVPAQ
ncbi:MAG TPA: Stk1 family PASTA domain-containing Ser/Thr kinase [Baekduia sp.]|nr:Stk1 family PASTA domain-containing Ser/Thr kinase [Baekduia sp.]